MKTINIDLLGHLNTSKEFTITDLITITTIDAQVARYTNFDRNILFAGNIYRSDDVRFQRSRTRWSVGITVDELELILLPLPESTISGVPVMNAVRGGILDGARVVLQRAYLSKTGSDAGYPYTVIGAPLYWFGGRLSGDVDVERGKLTMVVRSDLELLNTQLPKNVVQPQCLYTVYDSRCGVNRAAYTVATVVQNPSPSWFSTTMDPNAYPPGYFSLGGALFMTGANAGAKRTIKASQGGQFALFKPLANPLAHDDVVYVYPGCDRSKATCTTKFNNLAHFRGMPYVPVPETVLPL